MLSNLVAGISKVGEGFDGEVNEPIDIHFHKLLGALSPLIIYINLPHFVCLVHPLLLQFSSLSSCARGQQNLWWIRFGYGKQQQSGWWIGGSCRPTGSRSCARLR